MKLSFYILLLVFLGFQNQASAQDCPDSCKYYIPGLLTEDCDGIDCNILLIASNCTFAELEFSLYDLYGEIIFHSTDPKFNMDGSNYPGGTYVWKLEAKYCNHVSVNETRNIMILK